MNRREWMGKVGGATAGALMSQLIGTGPPQFQPALPQLWWASRSPRLTGPLIPRIQLSQPLPDRDAARQSGGTVLTVWSGGF